MIEQAVYDGIIIGAGQAGGPLSIALGRDGWKVALVERQHVGGTCINEGCTPTKTMIASARVAYLAQRAAGYGVNAGPVSVDLGAVVKRKRDVVESFRAGSQSRIENTEGVDLLQGEARFVGPQSIAVRMNDGSSRQLQADKIFINTGTRPSTPLIPGLDRVPVLNSTTIMELDKIPEHLFILGGGYIGLEFGQMFRRFGSRVTIIQRGGQLLAREDPGIADEISKILREDGIDVLLNANAVHAEFLQGVQLPLRLALETKDGKCVLDGSHLLAATGRVPNTEVLELTSAGVETDKRGYIVVNDQLKTSTPGIFAMGDIKGGPAFTHISYDDFRIIRTNLLEGGQASTRNRLVPYTVFIDPQLGRIGLSENEARALGLQIRVATMPMSWVARALELDESRGVMKVIVDANTSQILGAAILGVEGGELIGVLQMAMMGQIPYTVIRDATFAHPTLTESLNNLFAGLDA